MKTPDNLECSKLRSQEYKSLCQTILSVPPERKKSPRAFTGTPDTDLLILREMSDKNLINVCAVNKYVHSLCNNESFWLSRVLSRYGKALGSAREIKEKYVPDGTSWKEYYFWVSDFLNGNEDIAYQIAFEHNREDLQILLDVPPLKPDIHAPAPDFFRAPHYITVDLKNFLRYGNFGLSNPNDPNSSPLNDYISAGVTGITTRQILGRLMIIYIRINNMQNPINALLTATPEMLQYLGDTFIVNHIDPNSFRHSALQKIIKANTIRLDQLNQEQLNLLKDPIYDERLAAETVLYNNINTGVPVDNLLL